METSVNNKCKAFTSLEQSRKLAKILPIESADMYWMHGKLDNVKQLPTPNIIGNNHDEPLFDDFDVPCWSLAALFEVTSKAIVMNKMEGNGKYTFSSSYMGTYTTAQNPVDACVAMIEKLYKIKKL